MPGVRGDSLGDSNASPQVLREVERAVHHGIPIVPFKIQDVELNKSLSYFLSTPHWLDAISPPMERHIGRLSDAVEALLRRSPAGPDGGVELGDFSRDTDSRLGLGPTASPDQWDSSTPTSWLSRAWRRIVDE